MWWVIIGFAIYIALVGWFFLYFLPGEGVGPLAVHYTLVTDDRKKKDKEKNDEDLE